MTHWFDNEAAHRDYMLRLTLEGYALAGLTAVGLGVWSHAMWILLHRACG
jgi:hypothetical protein